MTFSAILRQPSEVSTETKLAFVEECLNLLELTSLGDTIVRGSSVERMKRLTIGMELAAALSVLFLDEPTNGLDARSAKLVMSGIRKISDLPLAEPDREAYYRERPKRMAPFGTSSGRPS
ncbi:unnamed protein product [Aphanomyces euteiches]